MKKVRAVGEFGRRYQGAFRTGLIIGLGVSILVLLLITATTLRQSRRNGDELRNLIQQGQREQKRAEEKQAAGQAEIKRYIACVARISIDEQKEGTTVLQKDLKSCDLKQLLAENKPISNKSGSTTSSNTPTAPNKNKSSLSTKLPKPKPSPLPQLPPVSHPTTNKIMQLLSAIVNRIEGLV